MPAHNTPAGRYADLLARHAQSFKTPETPWRVADGLYVSAPIWIAAKAHFLDALEQLPNLGCARLFSRDMVRTLRKHPALIEEAGDFRKRVERHAETMVHLNTDPTPQTLYHSSGATVSGTRQELAKATGLSYDRVRALLAGYRQYSNGWAKTPERARLGPAKPGRPRKPMPAQQAAPEPQDFFEAGESSFF